MTKDAAVWQSQHGANVRERQRWHALYAVVGSYSTASRIVDEVMLWATARPQEATLRRWAVEIDYGKVTPDPALEKIMRAKFDAYKAHRHWEFIDANIRAARKLADTVQAGKSIAQPAVLRYPETVINDAIPQDHFRTLHLPE